MGRCQECGTQGHNAQFCPEFYIIRGSQSPQVWLLNLLNGGNHVQIQR